MFRKDKARIINVAQCEGAEVMSELDIACGLTYTTTDQTRVLTDKYDELEASLESLRQIILRSTETDDDLICR